MARKISADGNTYYYYYKKKRGRKKKRGPKKKKKMDTPKNYRHWNYKILLCESNKQYRYIGVYHDLTEIETAKNILNERSNSVQFPATTKNSGELLPFKYEYLVLKRTTNAKALSTKIANEYGKWVENATTSNNWVIFDKFPAQIEETFWVYGYNPKKDRKTFDWIVSDMVLEQLQLNTFIQIFAYNNKVIFKYDDDFNFVICKNISDAIKMYNLIQEYCKKNKIKQVIFTGMVTKRTDRTASIVKMLQEKTGWSLFKIYRTSTRS